MINTDIQTKSGSNNWTYYFENGKQVYPCYCGEVHDNFYDWAHHQCGHDEVWVHDELKNTGYCVQCGKTIKLFSTAEDVPEGYLYPYWYFPKTVYFNEVQND